MGKSKKKRPELVAEKNVRCLLIRVKDTSITPKGKMKSNTRCFYTKRANRKYLIEFAKAFGAEILEVKAEEAILLPLRQLTEKFCDPSYTAESEYKVLKDHTPYQQHPAGKKVDRRKVICKQIRNRLLTGRPLGTQELYKRLQDHELGESTIRRYYTIVRTELEKEGQSLTQTGRGEYQID